MNLENIKYINSNGSAEDFEQLRKIHSVAMRRSIVESMGVWDDDFQKARLEKHFNIAYESLQFISYEGNIIGTINCHGKTYDDGIFSFVEQFYLLPEYQGRGIGGYILENKIGQEETRLTVLVKDTKTHEFYYKHGFVEYKEDEWQKYMKRMPQLKNKMKI